MSRSARRESTNSIPSKHSSSPATQPSRVDPVSRRARRTITVIIRVPTTADAIRQPNGSMPNSSSPRPMSHLPTSGWTTMLGELWNRPWRFPARI
jgi:hypothetical protein